MTIYLDLSTIIRQIGFVEEQGKIRTKSRKSEKLHFKNIIVQIFKNVISLIFKTFYSDPASAISMLCSISTNFVNYPLTFLG